MGTSRMNKMHGFTLIEVVIFIVATAILAAAVLLAGRTSILSAPVTSNQVGANFLAQQCMEWLLGRRVLNGYNTMSCPSTPTGAMCTAPSGFTITPSVTCTTLGSDTNFKTLTVVVSGNGSATLRTLIANY